MYNEFPSKSFQITVYQKDYKTPDWFSESIVYQIFPDRFCNANDDGTFLGNRNDIIKRNWGDQPYYKAEQFGGEYLANDFFGGNLEGIIKKLPYLESLRINAIYLNPIFKAYSNHKYDTGNYEEIEGYVSDLQVSPFLDSGADSFKINNIEFDLGIDFGVGYKKGAAYGGIVNKNGLHVKIKYIPYEHNLRIMHITVIDEKNAGDG